MTDGAAASPGHGEQLREQQQAQRREQAAGLRDPPRSAGGRSNVLEAPAAVLATGPPASTPAQFPGGDFIGFDQCGEMRARSEPRYGSALPDWPKGTADTAPRRSLQIVFEMALDVGEDGTRLEPSAVALDDVPELPSGRWRGGLRCD